jgi:hypothetical protein
MLGAAYGTSLAFVDGEPSAIWKGQTGSSIPKTMRVVSV